MDITNILKAKGITKAELAERLGIFSQNVNKMLINPTEATIKKIADAIGVPVWQLFASPNEILKESCNEVAGHCPHCGKKIRIKVTIESDEIQPKSSVPRKATTVILNYDDSKQYRYKQPHTPEERMAILELQTKPGEDGMVNVRNKMDGEVFDVEYNQLIPIK